MPEEESAGKVTPEAVELEEAAAKAVQPVVRVFVGTIAFLGAIWSLAQIALYVEPRLLVGLPLAAMAIGCLATLTSVFILVRTATGKARSPLIVAISPLMVAAIMIPIAFVNTIPQQIAQRLLAQRGVDFSSTGLQSQLYVLDYSALDLFLIAGVQTDAIFNVLGQETPFGEKPLVLEIIDNIRSITDENKRKSYAQDFVKWIYKQGSANFNYLNKLIIIKPMGVDGGIDQLIAKSLLGFAFSQGSPEFVVSLLDHAADP